MDRYERSADLDDAVRIALEGWQAGIFTCDVGIIESSNGHTCTLTIATQQQVQARDGTKTWVTLPQLVDVPLAFPSGGGFALTFPVQLGDECIVFFAQRCLDAWWQSGGVQQQAELRVHDISDGIAFVGIRSNPRRIAGVSQSAAQLRSDDGSTVVEVADGTITLKAPSIVTIDAPVTVVTGSLTVQGLLSFMSGMTGTGGAGTTMSIVGNVSFSGLLSNNGKVVGSTHTHPVTSAPGTTGAPT